jgi:16S rRNA (guanine527-N7)-methyltransferase
MPVIVSRETEDRLRHYESMVHKWQKAINLISPKTLDIVWDRHIVDSLQLIPLIREGAQTLFDFGSGAGFPGLVIAIARPDLRVTLVESDQRKCSFLHAVSRETKILVRVENVRIEQFEPAAQPDVITARALAPLTELLDLSIRFAQDNHSLQLLFSKGVNAAEEVEMAEVYYDFKAVQTYSETDPGASILSLTDLYKK